MSLCVSQSQSQVSTKYFLLHLSQCTHNTILRRTQCSLSRSILHQPATRYNLGSDSFDPHVVCNRGSHLRAAPKKHSGVARGDGVLADGRVRADGFGVRLVVILLGVLLRGSGASILGEFTIFWRVRRELIGSSALR